MKSIDLENVIKVLKERIGEAPCLYAPLKNFECKYRNCDNKSECWEMFLFDNIKSKKG